MHTEREQTREAGVGGGWRGISRDGWGFGGTGEWETLSFFNVGTGIERNSFTGRSL